MPVWLPFAMLAIGILAIYVEIFVPAAGLIGLAGGGVIVAGVVLAYVNHGPTVGTIALFSALVVVPTAIVIGLKAFPRTPVGRRLILGGPEADDGLDGENGGTPANRAEIVPGDEGEALTVLRPSGTARIGGRKLSVVTSGEFIDRGAHVRVLRVEGNRVVVRESS